jgi:hypothetical protein
VSCVTCGGWPALPQALGCCPASTTTGDLAVDAALWDAALKTILTFVPCWQVCRHTFEVCRPCRCSMSCNPCGCCRNRIQIPWPCVTLVEISSDGAALDPADWIIENGYLWPRSCFWPCEVSLTLDVGEPPPPGLVVAAKALWCRMVEDCLPGTCDLPEGTVGVTGPDGVRVQILSFDQLIAKHLTGIKAVDRLVAAYPCPAPEPRLIDPLDWQWVRAL